jgi:hypothetical protein
VIQRPLRGLGPGTDAARQVRRHDPVNQAAARGATRPPSRLTCPLPPVTPPVPRFARSRARSVMPSPLMPVVACPGPGGPVPFSLATYVTYHVTVNVTCHV